MITFVPAITLLACTIFPATTAYPIFAKPVNAVQARCGGMFALHRCLPLQVSPVFNFRYGAFALLASSFTLALARFPGVNLIADVLLVCATVLHDLLLVSSIAFSLSSLETLFALSFLHLVPSCEYRN